MYRNCSVSAMWSTAAARGFQPSVAAFDSWYSSLDNLKLIRAGLVEVYHKR
jgi:hypothetical protein